MSKFGQIGGLRKAQEPTDEEIFSTSNANDDFDQLNEEKLNYTKFSSSQYTQVSQHIDSEQVDFNQNMKDFTDKSN